MNEWTHIGGDLEAKYDGSRYVDIRAGERGNRIFISKEGLLQALSLFDKDRPLKNNLLNSEE